MDSKKELREQVISFVKKYYAAEKKAPTIREIADNVDGITRSNIYTPFPMGIDEIGEAAGVVIPSGRISRTRKASSARKRKSESGFRDLTLSGELAEDIRTICFFEKITPQDLIEKFVEDYRLFKTRYELNSNSVGSLAKFLKECESSGLRKDQIKKSMIRFVEMGLHGVAPKNFEVLMKIYNFKLDAELDFAQLLVVFNTRLDFYIYGYDLCTDYAIDEIAKMLSEKMRMKPSKALLEAIDIKTNLRIKRPTSLPRVRY
jgi:hypothetical protein